jgi:prepilin-type N-terminal cleavage/methylation domain-containing protein
MSHTNARGDRKGFTLVELAVVIVIIGVLAAFGVPRFLQSVERTKASEAFAFLSAVRGAQERYVAKEGFYATKLSDLDINQSSLKYFKDKSGTAAVTPDTAVTTTKFTPAAGSDPSSGDAGKPTWILTLKRDISTSSYGDYTVVFTQEGFDTGSTILTTSTTLAISPLPASAAYSSGVSDSGS